MQRMALGIKSLHLATVEIEPLFVIGSNTSRRFNRLDVTVHLPRLLDTVYRLGTGYESRWVDHVRYTARMHDANRVRQRLHQEACATRMVEMNVCQENVIDICNIEVLLM